MRWERYRTSMEQEVIKTEVLATEDCYFMATHVPFTHLEIVEGGYPTIPTVMTEDEVFERLICNKDNSHRVIIVKGNNGTGKSHLIRYFKTRFERGGLRTYDPDKEYLVFLRRLNNSVRGLFSQLVEQHVIRDPEIEDKIRRFVDSSAAKSEESFMTEILQAYITAVQTDETSIVYKPITRRDISQYLSDTRVMEHLLRENGSIARCYRLINTPSDQVLPTMDIFTIEDIKDRKIMNQVGTYGNNEAKAFVSQIRDENEAAKLVGYLNRLTGSVVKRCAEISSENTKSIFERLRRDLKEQGKNLTLFIEDFTGFTGIDSELITVLTTDHTGEYEDLCRVTAVIGITEGYYDRFFDNYKDRVTHQVNVTERSYGGIDFLAQMSAHYLNAIYCGRSAIGKWFRDGADFEQLPKGDLEPPCEWESVQVGKVSATLYPFNRKALQCLYNELTQKTPRMFLINVLRKHLKQYLDGKDSSAVSAFPIAALSPRMTNEPHSSAIDRIATISETDRARLKSVLGRWGDGTASAIERKGSIYVGGLNHMFLDDIGLGAFRGIGQTSVGAVQTKETSPSNPEPTPRQSRSSREIEERRRDIEEWFSKKTRLQFHVDYREWLRTFIREAVNWQAEGFPAYSVHERLSDLGGIYIDDQTEGTLSQRTLVHVKRTPDSRDALLALMKYSSARSWEFEDSPYYQVRLIFWLETNKCDIVSRIFGAPSYEELLPTIKWCLAVQYIKARLLGQPVDRTSPMSIAKSLLTQSTEKSQVSRCTDEWNRVIDFVMAESASFRAISDLLTRSAKTTMGAIHFAARSSAPPVYRAHEILTAVEHLESVCWDIRSELPEVSANNLILNPAKFLRQLYEKVEAVVTAETKHIESTYKALQSEIGDLSSESLVDLMNNIQEFCNVLRQHDIPYSPIPLFESSPSDVERYIMEALRRMEQAKAASTVAALDIYSENQSGVLSMFLESLKKVKAIAEHEIKVARADMQNLSRNSIAPDVKDTLRNLDSLYTKLEEMEVRE